MMKKFALVVGLAASLGCTSAAHAGYNATFTGFTGGFVIDQFGVDVAPSAGNPLGYTLPDPDHIFHVGLTNLNGKVSFQVPAAGNYSAQALPGFAAWIDYNGVPGPDLGVSYPLGTNLGSGYLSVGGTSAQLVQFDFNGVNSTTFKLDGVTKTIPYGPGAITLSGFGATTFLASLFGVNSLLGAASGTIGVTYTVGQDTMDVTIDETNLVTASGKRFEDVFLALDNGLSGLPVPPGNKDGKIDGTFAVNGTIQVIPQVIPEPGSLALLGIGLVGLAARRRKAHKVA